MILLTNLLLDFLTPAVLVLLVDSPNAQIGLLIVFKGIGLIQVIKYQPYKLAIRNLIEVVNQALYILILLLFLVLALVTNKISQE